VPPVIPADAYSLTSEPSEPVYVTLMQLTTAVPGLLFADVYSAVLPPSLSPIATVPDANELPLFDVVAENAENAPNAAIPPTTPAIKTVKLILRIVVTNISLACGQPVIGASTTDLSPSRGRHTRQISDTPNTSAGTTTNTRPNDYCSGLMRSTSPAARNACASVGSSSMRTERIPRSGKVARSACGSPA